MPSSMKIKFTDAQDLRQACYEATLDLNLYISHLKTIAQRCREHFPEVAEGLEGSASGIGQYLKGIDGQWITEANVNLRTVLTEGDFRNHLWAYEFSRDPRAGLMLLGCMAAVAAAKPEVTFWQAMDLSREKLSNLAPLIENLLASSPLRSRPQ